MDKAAYNAGEAACGRVRAGVGVTVRVRVRVRVRVTVRVRVQDLKHVDHGVRIWGERLGLGGFNGAGV